MSSTYQALCLNHDPAITIDGTWQHPDEALAAVVARRSEDLTPHATCDLLLGRYSYPLIEIACPPHSLHPRTTKWVDAGWVRLAALAVDSDDPHTVAALKALGPCWTADRLRRLRPHLDLCLCPDVDVTTFGELPGSRTTKGLDPACPVHAHLARPADPR